MFDNSNPLTYWLRLYPSGSAGFWSKTELHHIKPVVPFEPFCDVNEHVDPDIIKVFSTPRPAPDTFLLHLAPGWDRNVIKRPVLLVHGAGLDATSFVNLYGSGLKGLLPQLIELGYRVFALTFSHPHGDNFNQAEQLAAAILRVRQLCGAEQVDVVAHSKGGTAVRIYLSGLAATPCRGDVSHYIMLGTPNLGIDYAFRNPALSYLLYLSGGSAVIPWNGLNSMGIMVNTLKYSIYQGGCFPGQSQLLYRWDEHYPLDTSQQDWWTTYFGGSGFFSHSLGIAKAIRDGGSLAEKLDRHGIEPGVRMSVLAGTNNTFGTVPGECTGPSDGVVFAASVLATDGLARQGAAVIDKAQLPLNHLELLYARQAARWVDHQLQS